MMELLITLTRSSIMVQEAIQKLPKIFWTETEMQKLSLRFAEIMYDAEIKDVYKSYIAAIMEAQEEVLTTDRRRPKGSLQNNPKLNAEIRSLGSRLLVAKRETQASEDKNYDRFQVQQLAREATTLRETLPLTTPNQEVEDVQDTSSSTSPPLIIPQYNYSAMIDALVDSVGNIFREALKTKLNAVVNEVFEDIHLQISSQLIDIESHSIRKVSDSITEAKKPKVVVIGINKDQFNELEKEYGPYLNLDFVDSKKSNRLKAASQGAHHVAVNTASVSHQQFHLVRHHPGLLQSDGGSGAMKELLLDLVTKSSK